MEDKLEELQKWLSDGGEASLIEDNGQWTVNVWTKKGFHDTCRTFDTYEEAKAEYDRHS